MGAKRRWGRRFCRIQSDCIERSVLSLEPLEPRVLLSLSYTITDLGTPGGTFAAAVDINNDGQVTGYGYTAANTSESMRAFLWQNGALTVVPNFSLGGLTSVYGYAINENGVIAAATDFTTTPERASYYQGTTFSNIQNIASSYASTARGLNDATNPTVVGWYYDPNNSSQTYPFSWSVSTGMVTLAGSTGKAQDVNNSNQIVGSSMISGYPRAVLWQGGTMTNLDPTNNFDSAAVAINDDGQIAGWTRIVNKYHAFIWDDQTGLEDLGTLWDSDYGFSDSRDINNSGQVVGVSDIDPWDGEPADTYRAFIYDDGEMIRLETRVTNLGSWTLLAAEGINDNGQVVGWGRLNGNIRAFILNPVDSESPTAEAAAENVSMASGSPYQFSVIYSDNVAVDVSTLGSNDITVTGPGSFSQMATLVSVSDSSDGTPRTAIYRITPPGGTWDQADNGIYSMVLAANQVGDTSNNFAAAGELDSFAVDIKLKPLANLSYPAHSQTLPLTQINASQRYIDVAYIDRSGTGLNTQTIVDTGAEFSLTGSAAANVIVNGSPSLVAGTPATYRYSFTGDFAIGVVQVAFIAGAWSDNAGGVNDAETEQFELVMTDTQGPRVIHLEPDTLTMAGLTDIEVTFSEAISASSITKEDIKLWDPEGGVIVVDGVEKLANDSYKIKFTAQDKVGDYSVQIGPDIKDMFGNKMNQDSDGINGETPADIYTGKFTVASSGLMIFEHEPDDSVKGRVDHVDVIFSMEIKASSFTADDIGLAGPAGKITINGIYLEDQEENRYRIMIDPQDQAGGYSLLIGPEIETPDGELMNQDLDDNAGEPAEDIYQGSFIIEVSGLYVTGHAPSGRQKPGLDHVDIIFSEEINPISFDADDVSLTGPSGSINVQEVIHNAGNTYRVKFSAQNSEGSYIIEVGPDIYGPLDNYMNQDKDARPGEEKDDVYTGLFFIAEQSMEYVIVDVGTLPGGTYSSAKDVNDFGQVVGVSGSTNGSRAFIWENGAMTDLGTLGGTYSAAYAINNNGQILGEAQDASGKSHVVIWTAGGGITDLGAEYLIMGDINSGGEIVGSDFYGTSLTAFPSSVNGWHLILAEGISDGGIIVGCATPPQYAQVNHAAIVSPNAIQELPGLGGDPTYDSRATGISPGGIIVGYSVTSAGNTHACIWVGNAVQDIHTVTNSSRSYGDDVNNAGQAVGEYVVVSGAGTPNYYAFLYDAGQMLGVWNYAVNSWQYFSWYREANGINSLGEVVGSGQSRVNAETHGYYMRRPVQVQPTAILVNPANGATAPRLELNNRGYIDVTFYDDGQVGLDKSTIEDSTPELKLEGVAATYVTIGDKPTLVSENQQGITYRYTFTGNFKHGIVDVEVIDGSWYDKAGMPGEGKYESFTVGLDPDEYDKNGPDNTAAQASVISTDGTIQLHNIHQIGDVDWAKFYVALNSSIIIEADSQNGMTEMWLYGPDDPTKLLEHNVQGGENGLSARIARSGANQLAPGTYYVRVEELFDRYTIELYDLTVTKVDVQANVREIHGWNGYGDNPIKFGRYIGGIKMVDKNPDDGDFTFAVTLTGDNAGDVDKVEFKLGTSIIYTDDNRLDGWTWPGVPIHWLDKNTELKINTIDDDAKLKSEAYLGTVEVIPFPDWLTLDDEFTFWNPDTKTYHIAGRLQPESWDMAFEMTQSGLLSGITGFSPGLAVVINAGLKAEDSAISAQADVYMDAQVKGFNIWSHKDKRPLYLGQTLPFKVDALTLKPKDFHYEVEITDVAKINLNLGNPSAKYLLTRWYPIAGAVPMPIFFPFKDGVDWTRNRLTYDEGDIDWTQCDIYTVVNPISIPLPPDPTGVFSGASVDFTLGMILDVGFKLHINWDDARKDWEIQNDHGQFKVGCRLSGSAAPGVDILWGGLMCRLKGGPEGNLELMSNFTRIAGKEFGIPDAAGKYRFIVELIGSLLWLDKETFGIEDRLKIVIPNNSPTATIGPEDYYLWADVITWVEQAMFGSKAGIAAKSALTLPAAASASSAAPVYSREPVIASRGDGTLYKVFIEDADPGELFQPELFLQKKLTGQDWSTPIQVTQDDRPKGIPSIGFAADGDPLLAWTAQTSQQGPTQLDNMTSYEIYWARLDEQNPQAPVTPVRLTDNATIDGGVSIGVDQEGMLTWGQFNADSKLWNVRYALWDETGGFVIKPELVSDPAQYAAGFQSVQGPKDKGMTVWLSGALNAGKELTAVVPMYRIFSNGVLTDTRPIPLNGIQAQVHSIDVAFGPDGKAHVVWSQKEAGVYSVWFNTYDPDSQVWGQAQQVMDQSLLLSPQVCVTQDGKVNIIVAQWQQDNSQLLMTSFDAADPQAAWTEPEIIAESAEILFDQTAAADTQGNLILSWMEENSPVEYVVAAPTVVELQKGQSANYYDADGSLVTLNISGAASRLQFYGDDIVVTPKGNTLNIQGDNLVLDHIILIGENIKPTLNISAKGGSIPGTILNDISGESIGMIMGRDAGLRGDINLTGSLGMMMFGNILDGASITTAVPGSTMIMAGDIGDATLDIAGKVGTMMVNSFTAGSLTADEIGMVMPKSGVFGADLTARTGKIGMIMAKGDVTGNLNAATEIGMVMARGADITGLWRAGQKIGMVMADSLDGAILSSGGDVGMVMLGKDMVDTHLLAGYDIGNDLIFGAGDQIRSGNVGMMMVSGTFGSSYIGAGVLPLSSLTNLLPDAGQAGNNVTGKIGMVRFGQIDTEAAQPFGLYAATAISGKLQDQGAFEVRILGA